MPDEMMEKWLEYYDENGLSWLDTAVQAAIKQAFFAGGEAVEQMRAADVCLECENYQSCPGVNLVPDEWSCALRTRR